MANGQDYTPKEWRQILINAKAALDQNPNDVEAQAAFNEARAAIKIHVQEQEQANRLISETEMAQAQDPGFLGTAASSALAALGNIPSNLIASQGDEATERLEQGLKKLTGLPTTQDAARAISVENLLPQQEAEILAQGRESNPLAADIGDIGSLALPIGGALLGKMAGGRIAATGVKRATARAGLRGRELQNEILQRRLAKMSEELAPPPLAAPEATAVAPAPGAMQPLAGSAQGFEVFGPRATPPVPTQPTLLEMQQGLTPSKMARAGGEYTPYQQAAFKQREINRMMADRVAGQKGVTFGRETTYGSGVQAQIKQLLGELSRILARGR